MHQAACGLYGVLEMSRGSELYKIGIVDMVKKSHTKSKWSETVTTL